MHLPIPSRWAADDLAWAVHGASRTHAVMLPSMHGRSWICLARQRGMLMLRICSRALRSSKVLSRWSSPVKQSPQTDVGLSI
jgi:hypothetical protein